jgi:hypothetical protein
MFHSGQINCSLHMNQILHAELGLSIIVGTVQHVGLSNFLKSKTKYCSFGYWCVRALPKKKKNRSCVDISQAARRPTIPEPWKHHRRRAGLWIEEVDWGQIHLQMLYLQRALNLTLLVRSTICQITEQTEKTSFTWRHRNKVFGAAMVAGLGVAMGISWLLKWNEWTPPLSIGGVNLVCTSRLCGGGDGRSWGESSEFQWSGGWNSNSAIAPVYYPPTLTKITQGHQDRVR